MTPEEMQAMALALLQRKYVQRADERQKAMGLSYTEAETTDLAKTMVEFAKTVMKMTVMEEDENPFHPESPEGRAWERDKT